MDLIYVDFMKCDHQGRLVLSCLGTLQDFEKNNITPSDGLELVFYNPDEDDCGNSDNLVVSGILKYDPIRERWTAILDWKKN